MINKTFRRFIASAVTLMTVAAPLAQARQIIPAPPQLAASAYLLMDADTGKILVEHNADEQLPPASLTKMMTSYIVSSEIHNGDIGLDDMVNISVKAWKMGGSKMFIREGTQVPVKDLLKGVIVQSGNDASVALAEYVSGSEGAFADVMNQQAALLGMHSTHYVNATGWPAEGHLTTAHDLSLLARALINDYPEHYKLYSEKYFTYNGINQPNRNRLLFRDPSVDGLKTGHTEAAGFCLVASAKKNDMRLISVVMGTRSDEARAAESQKLLTYGFRYFQTYKPYGVADELASPRVWSGKQDSVALGVAKDLYLTIPRGSEDDLQATMEIDEIIKAPFDAGTELGRLVISLDGEELESVPLVAKEAVAEAGFFARLWDSIKLFFLGLFG
ncbi:D-alanyl-D-alanine carboxypeptidase family protein [Pseudomaricurvus sp. HS19]|uniref:D-alanyl-D-alanine carboxypeptidase family protein n=1 Tax=Pseudomaricurvus sp. HS19 TaxID=2692626 RepID=UPI00136FB312|nr:serine-type D-Ala-D-Ala carboxypeptidase [Pseudomaricurvus sp. HS19]